MIITVFQQTFELQRDLDDLRALINTKGAILHCECGDNHSVIRCHNHRGRFCQKDSVYHPPKNVGLDLIKLTVMSLSSSG